MPPDDIRHRLLRWDATLQMWRARKLEPINEAFGGDDHIQAQFMGTNRATYRLGRGMRGRTLSERIYKKLPPDQRGPYLPVIIDPSHAVGKRSLVPAIAKAAVPGSAAS